MKAPLRASAPPRETWLESLDTPVLSISPIPPISPIPHPDYTACLAQLTEIRLQLDKISLLLDVPSNPQSLTLRIEHIKQLVATQFDVSILALESNHRPENLVTARHVSMHLVRISTGLPHPEIARHFRKKDHGTVIHALERVKHRRTIDPEFDQLLATLERQVLKK